MFKKAFIHWDMDGISCKIVLNRLNDEHIDFEIIENPNDLNSRLQKFINEVKYFDDSDFNIIIADLDLKDDAKDTILNTINDKKFNFKVFDHHPTSVATLKNHPEYNTWLFATNEKSGCKIVYDYFNRFTGNNREDQVFKNFIDLVDYYDRGEWDDPRITDLNLLFGILGQQAFVQNINHKIETSEVDYFDFFDFEKTLIQQKKNEIESIVGDAIEHGIHKKNILGDKVAVTVISHKDISIICSKILEELPEYDYIINLDLKLMVAQLRTQRDNINLTDIAKRYGGGGHRKASGFPLHKYDLEDMINNILGVSDSKQEEWFK